MELHLEAKVVGKGEKGRTACGSSAYRACDKIQDNAGNVHDYTHKGGHVAGGIELPEGASEDLRNRQTLWSRHESKDKRKDAELFREVVVALPNDLDYIASARVARGISRLLTGKGMCVQWDVHDVTNDGQRNLHCHLMITMRELLPDGTFGNKNRSWNHYNGGLNIADLLRPEAARLMNIELEAIGGSKRVEHESYADRGIDKIPTKHMGVAATALQRKGVETRKGYENNYITFLNRIHAKNLQDVEEQIKPSRLDDLISAASAQKDGSETFRDWDALFAMLRDTRRCRAAMNSELKKLGKIVSAYEEGNESYLRWAGCNPESEGQRLTIQAMQNDLRIKIKEMDVTEEFLLHSKDLFRAHNKAVYTAKKAAWDRYMIERDKRGIQYCERRLEDIQSYMNYLNRSISMFDIIFNTQEYKDYRATMADLERQRKELWAQESRMKAELKQAKIDEKVHRKEAKEAAREEKKVKRQYEKQL